MWFWRKQRQREDAAFTEVVDRMMTGHMHALEQGESAEHLLPGQIRTYAPSRPLDAQQRTALRNRYAGHFANTLLERCDIPEASPVWTKEIAEEAVELADALVERLEQR